MVVTYDELKDDINNATSFCNESSITFCMRLGLYNERNQHCINTWTEKNAARYFVTGLSDQAS